MASRIEIASNVSFQSPSQVPLSKHDHMVETFPANTSDKAFDEWILPRTSSRREHLLDSHSLNPVSEVATVDSITVSYQISRCSIFRECFDDLLRRPFGGGMVGDIEMQYAAPLMRKDYEDKQHFQLQCGHSEEVDGDQVTDMVRQKGLPCLGWVFALLRHQTGNRTLGDFKPEFEKFTVN